MNLGLSLSITQPTGNPLGVELWDTPTTVDAGWTDNGDGTYTSDGTVSFLRLENGPLTAGRTYRASLIIDSETGVNLGLPYDGTDPVTVSGVGFHTHDFVENASQQLYIFGNGFTGTISSVSVREVL